MAMLNMDPPPAGYDIHKMNWPIRILKSKWEDVYAPHPLID